MDELVDAHASHAASLTQFPSALAVHVYRDGDNGAVKAAASLPGDAVAASVS